MTLGRRGSRRAATVRGIVLTGSAALAAAVALGAGAATVGVGAAAAGSADRPLDDPRITEASGLAPSLLHAGVLWTHNDSGNPPRLYAVGPAGGVTATLTLTGTADVDWEAIASFRDGTGRAMLAVGDIGDNLADRRSVQIVLLAEPPSLRSATVAPRRLLQLRYPDGPRDAEALLVDPRTQRMYVVSKGLFGGQAYAVPAAVYPGLPGRPAVSSGVLDRLGEVPLSLVTDGAVLTDGRVVLRTYGTLSVFPAIEQDGSTWVAGSTVALPAQRQGEGLAVPAGSPVAWLASEGRGEPLLAFALPAAFRAAAARPGAAATTGAARTPAGQPTDGRPAAGAPVVQAAGAAGLLLAAGGGGWLALRRRRAALRRRVQGASPGDDSLLSEAYPPRR